MFHLVQVATCMVVCHFSLCMQHITFIGVTHSWPEHVHKNCCWYPSDIPYFILSMMQLLKVCFCTRWHPCLQLTINSLFMTWDQGARNRQRIWITAVFKQVDPLIWGSTAPLTAPQRCCFSPHHQIPWLMLMILLSFTCSRPDSVSASYSSIFSQIYIQPWYSQPTSPYTVSSSTSSSLWNTGNGIMAPGVRLLIGQSRVSLEPRRVHIHSYVGQSTFALTCVIIFACMANVVYCKHEKMPSQISSKRPNLHRMHHHLCISDNCSVSKISLVWNRRLLRILPRAQICAPSILCSFVTT